MPRPKRKPMPLGPALHLACRIRPIAKGVGIHWITGLHPQARPVRRLSKGMKTPSSYPTDSIQAGIGIGSARHLTRRTTRYPLQPCRGISSRRAVPFLRGGGLRGDAIFRQRAPPAQTRLLRSIGWLPSVDNRYLFGWTFLLITHLTHFFAPAGSVTLRLSCKTRWSHIIPFRVDRLEA